MKKITAYEVFSVHTPTELEKFINQMIAKGWQPYGSLQVCPDGKENILFVQAMVKYED